jgi:hypothetical protein
MVMVVVVVVVVVVVAVVVVVVVVMVVVTTTRTGFSYIRVSISVLVLTVDSSRVFGKLLSSYCVRFCFYVPTVLKLINVRAQIFVGTFTLIGTNL